MGRISSALERAHLSSFYARAADNTGCTSRVPLTEPVPTEDSAESRASFTAKDFISGGGGSLFVFTFKLLRKGELTC